MNAHDKRNEAIKAAIAAHSKMASPESARASLIASGIYTSDGKLHPNYGGTP